MKIGLYIRSLGDIFFFFVLRHHVLHCESVLDVGCGYNSSLGAIHIPIYKEGIDIFTSAVDMSKKKKIHDSYKIADIRKLNKLYNKKSFDAVMSIDVIEHLTRAEGEKLLKHMEDIARKRVILLTPNGFYHQHDIDHNPYQVHKSGWSVKDFNDHGYTVYGLRGFQQLRDDHASIRFRPWIFWGIISLVSEIALYYIPQWSFDLFAVKMTDGKK